MEEREFDLETGKLYTASIEWNGQCDKAPGGYELEIDGRRISIEEFGKYLVMHEGWKLDLRLLED